MSKASTDAHVGRHVRCRNLIWETAPDGSHAPGRYCSNRLGVVHALDCPVFQGGECCLFETRPEDELADVPDEAELDHIRARLARDYLRWPYWRRLEVLRGSEAPEGEVEDLPDVIEVGPAEPEEAEETDEPVAETPAQAPAAAEETVHERYPGQRRSEEEQRARRGEEPDSFLPVDDEFVKGIFAGEPEEASAPETEKPEKPEDTEEKKPPSKRRRRRRRPRRRRGKGKSKDG